MENHEKELMKVWESLLADEEPYVAPTQEEKLNELLEYTRKLFGVEFLCNDSGELNPELIRKIDEQLQKDSDQV